MRTNAQENWTFGTVNRLDRAGAWQHLEQVNFRQEWFAVLATVVACESTIPGPPIPAEQAGTAGTKHVGGGDGAQTGRASAGERGGNSGTVSAKGGSAGKGHETGDGDAASAGGDGTKRDGSSGDGAGAGGSAAHAAGGERDDGDGQSAGSENSASAGHGDGGTGGEAGASSDEAGASSGEAGAFSGENAPGVVLVPGVSERKRVRSPAGRDLVLEEALIGFSATLPQTRLRRLTANLRTAALWAAPDATYISDFCVHPSGELSVVLVSTTGTVSLVRLDAQLNDLGTSELHDPDAANDPHAAEAGVTDLSANGLALDSARIGAKGEAVFTVVVSTVNAVIGYQQSFGSGGWSTPDRTLVEPPVGLTPFLPIGGSFDTFGAIVAWFRASLDMDESGNAYVAIWAGPPRIRAHVSAFQDGLTALPGDPNVPNAGDSERPF